MPNITNTAIINLLATEDLGGNTPINRGATPSFDGSFADFVMFSQVNSAAPTSLPIPFNGIAYQVYIKNISTVASLGIDVVVTMQNSGVSTKVAHLGPGDVYMYWSTALHSNVTANATAPVGVDNGLTSINIQASVANGLVEYFIGG